MASKSNTTKKPSAAAAASGAEAASRSVESKLARLLSLASEADAEKILTMLKSHGLNKTQVLALVEAIRREEQEIIFADSVLRGELQTSQEDLMDEADLASSDIDQGMKMRMANRDRKSTRLNSSHSQQSRMPSSA